MHIFDSIARGNSDITSDCQMMSYPYVEKYLNMNKHLNLNLENKTPY